MLLGCWLLSEALHLQAGQIGGLLLLMAVLRPTRACSSISAPGSCAPAAPRGTASPPSSWRRCSSLDAPLLAAECVTADARVGTGVAALLVALAVAKLAWVRRAAPDLLSRPAARPARRPGGIRPLGARARGPSGWSPGLRAAGALRAVVGDASPAARPAGPPSRDGGRRRGQRAHAAWTWVPAAWHSSTCGPSGTSTPFPSSRPSSRPSSSASP